MVVLRRTQVLVASAAGILALVLVFLLGMALGGTGAAEADAAPGNVGVWVLRVVSYKDTARGHEDAQTVKGKLVKFDLGDEVGLRRTSDGWLVVTAGAWLHDPNDNAQARELMKKVKDIKERSGAQAFPDAHFWLIRR